ncbi:MAG: phosphoribosylamine--glycine ligase [Syntrophorhabdales bacterium]|jgi:phosphoribosylamine--glycine ligase
MRILVIGSGGREHALVWKLAQSPKAGALFCAPGNGGISQIASCIDIDATDIDGLLAFARKERIGLVVVGPEGALAAGIVDRFEAAGIPIFGPCEAGSRIETSKVFAKALMEKYGVPTASFRTFDAFDEAVAHIGTLSPPYVIKADGLAAGKGAYVIDEADEGEGVLRSLLVDRVHGEAGKRVIVEEFLSGVEVSYLAFSDGSSMRRILPSQDHKALLDGDRGPNTGGMGAYTPVPFVGQALEDDIDETIMKRTVEALAHEGIPYRGVLYGGLMIHGTRPSVLEFNARFGDPETQPILLKMASDLLPVVSACAEGDLRKAGPLDWKDGVAVCVVVASRGYPDRPEKGKLIRGLGELEGQKDVVVFHAGTKRVGKDYYTSGGRVLGVTAHASTYAEAIRKVYEAVSCIEFEGMYFRRDIGRKALDADGVS